MFLCLNRLLLFQVYFVIRSLLENLCTYILQAYRIWCPKKKRPRRIDKAGNFIQRQYNGTDSKFFALSSSPNLRKWRNIIMLCVCVTSDNARIGFEFNFLTDYQRGQMRGWLKLKPVGDISASPELDTCGPYCAWYVSPWETKKKLAKWLYKELF